MVRMTAMGLVRAAGRVPQWTRELALLAALYLAYSAGRLVGDSDRSTAVANAEWLLAAERWLRLDVEAWANDVLHELPWLAVGTSYWYAVLHYVVTPAVLVWAYRARRDYAVARNALGLASAVGLVGFALLPMAPPRMLPGYTDTLAATSSYGWWGAQASAPRGLGELTNQLAAMPSLHVGWAVWCAWVVWRLTGGRRWARVLAVAYPVVTTAVVVATANHYVLDAVAGALVVAAGIAAAGAFARGAGAPSQQGVIHRQRSHWEWEVTQTWGPPQRGQGSRPVPQLVSSTRRS